RYVSWRRAPHSSAVGGSALLDAHDAGLGRDREAEALHLEHVGLALDELGMVLLELLRTRPVGAEAAGTPAQLAALLGLDRAALGRHPRAALVLDRHVRAGDRALHGAGADVVACDP